MNKHHFILKHNGQTYKCYLEEKGDVFILDREGNPRKIEHVQGVDSINTVREKILAKIDSFEW